PVTRCLVSFPLFLLLPLPPRSTLFPYTTLFRSETDRAGARRRAEPARAGGPGASPRRLPPLRRVAREPHRNAGGVRAVRGTAPRDRKSTRLNSSHVSISYAVFCLKKKTKDK